MPSGDCTETEPAPQTESVKDLVKRQKFAKENSLKNGNYFFAHKKPHH